MSSAAPPAQFLSSSLGTSKNKIRNSRCKCKWSVLVIKLQIGNLNLHGEKGDEFGVMSQAVLSLSASILSLFRVFLVFLQGGAEFLGWFLMPLCPPLPGASRVPPDTRGQKEQYFDWLYTINRSVSEPGCACEFCVSVYIFGLLSGCVLGAAEFLMWFLVCLVIYIYIYIYTYLYIYI